MVEKPVGLAFVSHQHALSLFRVDFIGEQLDGAIENGCVVFAVHDQRRRDDMFNVMKG